MDKNGHNTEDEVKRTARSTEQESSRPPTYEEVLDHPPPPQIGSGDDVSKTDAELLLEALERGEAKTPDYEEL